MSLQGKRITEDIDPFYLKPLEYTNWRGFWWACCPDGKLANLGNHKVVEHKDGSITVHPSILVTEDGKQWHGYIEKGLWIEC
jgi:hypothetical protein